MTEKISFLIIIYLAVLASDVPRLKRTGARGRIAYCVLMAGILYLSVYYVLEPKWPNLDEGFNYLLGGTAKRIVKAVKLSE